MPRKPRFYLPGVSVHVMQRGHDRLPVFFCDDDYRQYLIYLKENAERYSCSVHAYVLMTNHIHLLLTPELENSVSSLFQGIGRQYVTYINKTYQKSGSLWEGRHKGCIIDSERYLLSCMRYIELNAVRASMVDRPEEYYWSSFSSNAEADDNAIITPHDLYLSLGRNKEERSAMYSNMFKTAFVEEELKSIRAGTQTGTPLGNDKFKKYIEQALACRVGHSTRGRPKNN